MSNKGAKAWRENFVSTFYGINSKTFAVEGVAQISSRLLSKWCGDQYVTHEMPANADVKSEIERAYSLVYLVEVPAEQDSIANVTATLEDLRRKASGMQKVWKPSK